MGQVYFKDFESYFAYVAREILNERILVWTVWTKNGKASEKIGFISLSNFTPCSVEVHGFSDKKVMKKLVKLLGRKDKYTYAEDALQTMINYCFEDLKIHRLETECFNSNAAQILFEKVGFTLEGLKLDSVKIENDYESVLYYGLINPKEADNVVRGKVESTDNRSAESIIQPEPVHS